REMLGNIEEKWLTEIQNLCKNVPFFLVGLKADTRDSAPVEMQSNYVSTQEGKDLAQKIGAKYFAECSALTRKNVKETFKEIALYVSKHQKSLSKHGFRLFWCC